MPVYRHHIDGVGGELVTILEEVDDSNAWFEAFCGRFQFDADPWRRLGSGSRAEDGWPVGGHSWGRRSPKGAGFAPGPFA